MGFLPNAFVKYVILEHHEILLVVQLESGLDVHIYLPILEQIAKRFRNRFKDEIQKDGRFSGDVKVFDSFTDDLNKLLQIKSPNKEKNRSSELLQDLLGIKKKINYKRVLANL